MKIERARERPFATGDLDEDRLADIFTPAGLRRRSGGAMNLGPTGSRPLRCVRRSFRCTCEQSSDPEPDAAWDEKNLRQLLPRQHRREWFKHKKHRKDHKDPSMVPPCMPRCGLCRLRAELVVDSELHADIEESERKRETRNRRRSEEGTHEESPLLRRGIECPAEQEPCK